MDTSTSTDDWLSQSALPSVPVSRSLPGGSPGASGLSGLLQGADAEAELVRGVLDHQLIMTAAGTRAAVWLRSYGLGDVVDEILFLRKFHQRPAGLVKALDSISLKEFLRGMDIQIGNK